MIKIAKTDLNGNGINLAPSYITNGHWAVKLEAVENGAMMNTIDKLAVFAPRTTYVNEMEDSKVKQVWPKKSISVTYQGNIYNKAGGFDKKDDLVEFSNEGIKVYFKRRYAEMLDLAGVELWCDNPNGAFTDADGSFVIMPMMK